MADGTGKENRKLDQFWKSRSIEMRGTINENALVFHLGSVARIADAVQRIVASCILLVTGNQWKEYALWWSVANPAIWILYRGRLGPCLTRHCKLADLITPIWRPSTILLEPLLQLLCYASWIIVIRWTREN